MDQETIDLPTGGKLHFKKHPRYGTWSLNFDKGAIPERLAGQWQSLADLKEKTFHYLEHREKNKVKMNG
jgi:hypothetical protein